MPRLIRALEPLFARAVPGQGSVHILASGRLRQLWFIDNDGETHLQTEALCEPSSSGSSKPGRIDVNASLRRTPYLGTMFRRLEAARAKRILVLGLGGGLLPAALMANGAEVVVVERSQLVADLARDFFALGHDTGLKLHVCDAEEFVNGGQLAAAGSFDGLAIDIFQAHTSLLPDFAYTDAFHQRLRTALLPGARVVQNALAHGGHIEEVVGGRLPASEVSTCLVRRRHAAPKGPLFPGIFLKNNPAGAQLTLLAQAFQTSYGASRVITPCSWALSRIVEADLC